MPTDDDRRAISRLRKISPAERQRIADRRADIARERARKRIARGLRPKASIAGDPPTSEEWARYHELAVDLTKRGLLDANLTDADTREVERRIWSWMRTAPRVLTWGQFVAALRIEQFGPPPVEVPIGSRPRERDYGNGHLSGRSGW